ncbi:MAG: hypothetical protein WA975_17865 [Mesorhizobium sp.]
MSTDKTRSLSIFGDQGDVTIVWTDEEDDKMEAIITEKMKAGIIFFIVEPRFFGLLPPKRTALTDAADARKHRALSIKDEQFSAFVEAGHGDVVKTPDKPVTTVKKAETAKEVASNHAIGVRQLRGG